MIENEYREKRKRNFELTRMIKDITMAVLILGMAIVLFFGVRWNIPQIVALDSMLRYMLGGLFVMYGLFRLYRGLKRDY